MFRRFCSLFVASVLLGPVAANAAVTYQFSFDNVFGSVPGTIQGTITLDFLASGSANGTGAASDLRITSAPAGIPAAVEGADITGWSTQARNTFEVVNGVIVDYEFGAAEGSPPGLTDNVLCLNNGGFFVVGGVYICGPGENYYGDAFAYVYNTDGIRGVTFQQIPEPGTLALLGLGLAGLAATRRRKQ